VNHHRLGIRLKLLGEANCQAEQTIPEEEKEDEVAYIPTSQNTSYSLKKCLETLAF
jgi:hypothetical protein